MGIGANNIEWLWAVVALGGVLYLWEHWRSRKAAAAASAAPTSTPLGMNMASDRELMLATFRRELANYLVRLDPDRFLRIYRKAQAAEAAIGTADKAVREAELTIITNKYPMYTDFDFVGTREHVLYADSLSNYAIEDIEEHYLNLVKFQALQRALNPDWQFRSSATSDKDLEHLQEYARKIKDTKFKQRIDAAIAEFHAFNIDYRVSRLSPPGETPFVYETDVLAVCYVPHIMESRIGFHFKDTDEYALYSVFYADGRDEPYRSFYRSDANFEAENYIEHLLIDEKI